MSNTPTIIINFWNINNTNIVNNYFGDNLYNYLFTTKSINDNNKKELCLNCTQFTDKDNLHCINCKNCHHEYSHKVCKVCGECIYHEEYNTHTKHCIVK